jgi:hypothetical protein
MDILSSNREKMILKLGITLARKKLGKRASVTSIHDELINNEQPFIRKTALVIKDMYDSIPDEMIWQKSVISEIGEFILWCAIHHPKFRYILLSVNKEMFSDYKLLFTKSDWVFSKVDIYLTDLILKYTYNKICSKDITESFTRNMNLSKFSNPAITEFNAIITKAINEKCSNNEVDRYLLFTHLLLYIVMHDTAYRDVFFWGTYQLANKSTKKMVEPYYVPLNKCYLRLYVDGKEHTRKLKDKGLLAEYEKSLPEKYCVPRYRQKHIQTIIKKGKK